jgi:hypothetical protein
MYQKIKQEMIEHYLTQNLTLINNKYEKLNLKINFDECLKKREELNDFLFQENYIKKVDNFYFLYLLDFNKLIVKKRSMIFCLIDRDLFLETFHCLTEPFFQKQNHLLHSQCQKSFEWLNSNFNTEWENVIN